MANTRQHTSTQTNNRQPRMDPSRGQQQPTGENAPGEHFHIVGPRRNQSVAPQGAAGQQAASGGRRARSERSDQPSPNARGGATQRTYDVSVALTGGPMAIGQVAPAQAQQLMLQHQYWQQQQQPQTMQQAIQFPPGPYSHVSSGGAPSPGYDYANSGYSWHQVRRNAIAWHEACASCMTCTWPAFWLAVGLTRGNLREDPPKKTLGAYLCSVAR